MFLKVSGAAHLSSAIISVNNTGGIIKSSCRRKKIVSLLFFGKIVLSNKFMRIRTIIEFFGSQCQEKFRRGDFWCFWKFLVFKSFIDKEAVSRSLDFKKILSHSGEKILVQRKKLEKK